MTGLAGSSAWMIHRGGTLTNTYDTLDRLLAQSTTLGTVSYAYDALGRRTLLNVPGITPTTYAYDDNSRLTQIARGTQTVGLEYDDAGRRRVLTLPNAVTTEYQYDDASRLTALIYRNTAGILGNLTYQYDPTSNRSRVGGTFARTLLPSAVASAAYNAGNRQVAFGPHQMTFDANGNLTTLIDAAQTTNFTWDARDRLIGLEQPGTLAAFEYSFGRRLAKTVNGTATQFLYDGLDITQQLEAHRATTYLRSLAVDETLGLSNPDGAFFVTADALGSTVAVTDMPGNAVTEYTYDTFGGVSATNPAFPNPFQFTGRENDGLAGLYYYRARYYHPGLHRFISEDPIGLLAGDTNFYAYAGDNPVTFVDPFGLDKNKRCATSPAATRVFFTGVQFSGLVGGLYGPDRRGFGKEATYGIAWEAGTWNIRKFKSVGIANLEDPEGEVTGINLGIGVVLPLSHVQGNFQDFEGEATEESLAFSVAQYTQITTSSGRSGASGTVGLGLSAAATRLRTVTTFPGCSR